MNVNIICDYSEFVHDNIIQSYSVDMEKRMLEIDTIYHANNEKTKITFTGLLAHRFEEVVENNIIFGIEQITVDCFIELNMVYLEQGIRYGFPMIGVSNIARLKQRFVAGKYNIYDISASCGLSGFVIAKEISILKQVR